MDEYYFMFHETYNIHIRFESENLARILFGCPNNDI